jgi:23S rRNA pseudouridine2605 synthase
MARPHSTQPGVAERLQKYLAQRGLGSRRAIEEWIRAGRISVNGKLAELGQKVTHADDIRLDGRTIKTRATEGTHLFVFNRSPGDPLREGDGERTPLIERLPRAAGKRFIAVSPMPGIDGGLELVTSDGALAAKLQRAIHRLPCEFSVRVKGQLGPDQLEGVKSGKLDRPARMIIDSMKHSEADLEGSNRWYGIVARGASGKDIRQLFERQGALVSRVLRISVGSLKLEKDLARGQHRQVDAEQTAALLKSPAATDSGD